MKVDDVMSSIIRVDKCDNKIMPTCVWGDFEKYVIQLEKTNISFEYVEEAYSLNTNLKEFYLYKNKKIHVRNIRALDNEKMKSQNILIVDDYPSDYLEYLKNNQISLNDSNIFWLPSEETSIALDYEDKYKDDELKNIIVFRSGPHESEYVKGMDFSDNARALFEYMLSVGLNNKYELIWIVNYPDEYNKKYKCFKNVKFISWNDAISDNMNKRDEYHRILYHARFFFFTDAYGFCKNARKDQIRVQLWHGCGFKTRVNFAPCEHRYEYNTVIGEIYKEIHKNIYGLREEQVIITGYPKEDWLFEKHGDDYIKKFDLPKAKKYIFWLPTFRSTGEKLAELDLYNLDSRTGLPIINTYEQLNDINRLLKEKDLVLIVKLHPFQDQKVVNLLNESNIVAITNNQLYENDVQINQLLTISDALISDYSSVAVDYMQLDRPIAFTLEDLEEYKDSRGFVFDNIQNWLPGYKITNIDDLKTFIYEIADDLDSSSDIRHELFSKMHRYNDNKSSKRICDYFGIK